MHIFISYAKADTRDLALHLREAFTALAGVTACMDTSLYSGEDWATQIQDEIDRADLVIALLSQDVNRPANHPNGRSFVLKEIHYAQQVKKTIIPVMAQMTRVPVQLAGIEYIDFTHNSTAALQRLLNEVANRAGISVVNPVEPIQPRLYRRPVIIVGLVVFMIIASAVTVFPSFNTPPKVTATGVGVGIVPTDTSAAIIVNTSDTPLITSSPVSTDLSTSTSNMTAIFPGNPVTKNADWTPHYQTFNGYEMAQVPAGCFMMGSADHPGGVSVAYKQCVESFWIDRYEVTNKQYGSEGEFKGDNRPRDSVTWAEARDFCLQRGARLPTESEWEYAARGPSDLVFPWGNDFDAANVIYLANSNGESVDVGSRPTNKSWVGAYDMSGNLWEWVSTIFKDYPYDANDGHESANDNSTGVKRVLRGGAWKSIEDYMRTANRGLAEPSIVHSDVGFRCTRSQ